MSVILKSGAFWPTKYPTSKLFDCSDGVAFLRDVTLVGCSVKLFDSGFAQAERTTVYISNAIQGNLDMQITLFSSCGI